MVSQRLRIDLYIASMADFALPLKGAEHEWRCLSSVNPADLRTATIDAFKQADRLDRDTHERIVTEFIKYRESMPEHSWLVYRESLPVGACLVSRRDYVSSGRTAPYIDLVAVSPTQQNQGLGRALLRKAGKSLWDAGFRDLLHAHIRRGNLASERLFGAVGFCPWPTDHDHD